MTWQHWLKDLPHLEKLEVTRCYKASEFDSIKSCQLHHLSDASEKGDGTASYVRLEDKRGQVSNAMLVGRPE
jgi:hypothetical protein